MSIVFARAQRWLSISNRAIPWSAFPGRTRRDSDRGSAGEGVLLAIVALVIMSLATVVLIMLKVNSTLDHVTHP